jgi:hypothetical protein
LAPNEATKMRQRVWLNGKSYELRWKNRELLEMFERKNYE